MTPNSSADIEQWDSHQDLRIGTSGPSPSDQSSQPQSSANLPADGATPGDHIPGQDVAEPQGMPKGRVKPRQPPRPQKTKSGKQASNVSLQQGTSGEGRSFAPLTQTLPHETRIHL